MSVPHPPRWHWLPLVALALVPAVHAARSQTFSFGPEPLAPGRLRVASEMEYAAERGYGFEPGFDVRATGGGVTGVGPAFFFSVTEPEGNYRVTAAFTGAETGGSMTVKAELRRLMLERLALEAGRTVTRTFIVNVRTPRIAAGHGIAAGAVRLKAPRETTQEAWAWDSCLTLEFDGKNAVLLSLSIEPTEVPTIFLIGDSTVCDQSREPYTSWGQMFPRFFGPDVAVANHAESGETYRDSLGRRRLDKIISVMQPGDWLLMQFGHNDQKQIAAGTGGPFTTYEDELKRHIAAVRARGGIPVVVTPMERRNFDTQGRIVPTLADYAEASRQAAEEEGVACIDLNAMSRRFYEALGPEKCPLAFAAPGGKVDNTHHDAYGAYELAKCVAEAAREQKLGFAKFLAPDFVYFDPAHPDPVGSFAVPPSPLVTNVRPLGD